MKNQNVILSGAKNLYWLILITFLVLLFTGSTFAQFKTLLDAPIAADSSKSTRVDCAHHRISAVIVPYDDWTTATVSFKTSNDTTYETASALFYNGSEYSLTVNDSSLTWLGPDIKGFNLRYVWVETSSAQDSSVTLQLVGE
jgi:hypothetical protein